MTYEQAIVVRQLQLQGRAVGPDLLEEAIRVIQTTSTPTRGPRAGEKARAAPPVQAGGDGE